MRRLFSRWRFRLRSLVRPARAEHDLDDELLDHIERRVADAVARGEQPAEARREALRAFGGVEQAKEQCRDVRHLSFLEQANQDIRFALRHLVRIPVTAATIVGIFALGIGFSTSLRVFVQSVTAGSLPGVPKDESLVRIRGIDRTQSARATGREVSYPEYRDYATQDTAFRDVAAWTSSDVVFDIGLRAPDLHSGAATYVTGTYFQTLGLQPALGVGLPVHVDDADPDPPLVAVISYALWDRHFDRSTDVIGREMKVNGVSVTIVGVAPRRFAGARTGGSQMRVWLPLATRPLVQHTPSTLASYADARFGLVARLQPRVQPTQADPVVRAVAARAAREGSTEQLARNFAADVVPLLANNYFPPPGIEEEERSAGSVFALMVPVLVLLITCTNVSALLAGLGVKRRREIAVRLALGASRYRIVRQLLTETIILGMAAGALALFTIWVLLRLFDANIPDLTIEIDARSILFTAGLALLASVLFGLSPALHATRLAMQGALKDSAGTVAGRSLRLQSWLVIAQIAFTQPALMAMGAVLLEMRSNLGEVSAQPLGDRLVEVRFNVNPRYGAVDENRERTLVRIRDRLAMIPGVDGALPQEHVDSFDVDVHPDDAAAGVVRGRPHQVRGIAAPAGYFPMMQLAFERGRDFDPGERDQLGPVVIGSRLAREVWGGENPVGRRLVAVGRNLRDIATFTVVGVVDDATSGGRSDEGRVYMPAVHTTGYLLVRTRPPADRLLQEIRAAAADEAPTLPIVSAQTISSIEASARRSLVSAMSGATAVGLIALGLSAVGLYAVVAFAVSQRVREIGIRTALGAETRQVVGLFLRRGLSLALVGMACGLALGIVGVRLISAADGNPPPSGMFLLSGMVAVSVAVVALLATWIPARKAARVDPLEALRIE